MEVHLKPEQEAYLDQRVREGRFGNTDEALQEAVALLEREEAPAGPSTEEKSKDSRTIGELIAAFQACPIRDFGILPEPVYSSVREPAF